MEDYWDIIENCADMVISDMKDTPEEEWQTLIDEEIDRNLIYYSDQATILGAMLIKGIIKWGQEIEWEYIYEEMLDDIYNEIKEKKGNE